MRDGVATSLFPLFERSSIVRSILEDLSRNSINFHSLPAPDLFVWSAQAAAFFCRGVEENASKCDCSVHWVLLYSNRYASHVMDVSHLTSGDRDPEVASIRNIVVINFSDIFKSISRLYAAATSPSENEPDILTSLTLIDILGRLDFRRDDRLFNGVLLALAPHLRFIKIAEVKNELLDAESDYIRIYGRIIAAFVVCHEFAHLIWNNHPPAVFEFKTMVVNIIRSTADLGHNFECFLGEGMRGFHLELEVEPALRKLLTVHAENVEAFLEELDIEELFCDFQAVRSLVQLVLTNRIFESSVPDEPINHLAKIRVGLDFVSLYNSSINHILAVLERVGAHIRVHDRYVVSDGESQAAVERAQARSQALAIRSIVRCFLGERMLDAEVANQLLHMTGGSHFVTRQSPNEEKEETRTLAEEMESIYVSIVSKMMAEDGVIGRNGATLQRVKSNFGDIDKIAAASAVGSALKIAAEYYAQNPGDSYFDFYSYFVGGTAAFR